MIEKAQDLVDKLDINGLNPHVLVFTFVFWSGANRFAAVVHDEAIS